MSRGPKEGPGAAPEGAVESVEARFLASPGAAAERQGCVVPVEQMVVIEVRDVGSYSLMCTPADLRALAVGFAFTEGIIGGASDVLSLAACEDDPGVIRLWPARPGEARAPERNLLVTSSCGLCGSRAAVEAFFETATRVGDSLRLSHESLVGIMGAMRPRQALFSATGGTHAAGICDAQGRISAFAEDVGRHNALDKAIGQCLLAGGSAAGCVALLSGRVSFELVAKCARAGVELIAAVSAPSSLAVRAAEHCGITLCGFVREGRATVYANPRRLLMAAAAPVPKETGG